MKISDRVLTAIGNGDKSPFSAIIFDCDGVLIDSSRSYDLSLELSAKAFASLLGFKFQRDDLYKNVESLRRLGTFNNDWDTLAVISAFMYSKSKTRQILDSISSLDSPTHRIRAFESTALELMEQASAENLNFLELETILGSIPSGAARDQIISRLILEPGLLSRFYECISYPKPVGESLLGTFFDEAMYGSVVFKGTYGFECVTSKVSKPGFITNERLLVKEKTLDSLSNLCSGTLGIITGRPKMPTIFSLGKLFSYFKDQEICKFTGDYLLNSEEVKPSPKPMLRVASALKDKKSPILYVGDSGEDLLLAKRVNATKLLGPQKIFFAAIAHNRDKAAFFEKEGGEDLDCIVSNVNELPALLMNQVAKDRTE